MVISLGKYRAHGTACGPCAAQSLTCVGRIAAFTLRSDPLESRCCFYFYYVAIIKAAKLVWQYSCTVFSNVQKVIEYLGDNHGGMYPKLVGIDVN